MYDNRYPHCHPIDGPLPSLSPEHAWSARLVGKAVALRTGTNCFYVSTTGKLLWVYGNEPAGGPLQVPFRTKDGIVNYTAGVIDDMVEWVQRGKVSAREKQRVALSNQKSQEHDNAEARGRFLADRRPEALKRAEYLDRKRRGTQTLSVSV